MDHLIFNFFNHLASRSLLTDGIIIFFAEFFIYFLPMLGALIYFLNSHRQKTKYRQWFLKIILSLVLAELIYFIIGIVYHRPRPFLAYPLQAQLLGVLYSQSFPSNHTILSFIFSFNLYRISKKLGVVFVVLSLLIGLARVAAGAHYPSDILGGIIVAFFSTWLISKIVRSYR